MNGPPSICAAGRRRRVVVAERGLRGCGVARGGRCGRDEPRERHGVAVQRRGCGARQLRQRLGVAARRHAGERVVVDPPVGVQRLRPQAGREACDDRLSRAERLRERAGLCFAVTVEERRARPAVEHERAQAVRVARGVGERDPRAVAGPVELDVADAERGAHGVEVAGGGAGSVGVAAIADGARAPAAARVDEHDVVAGAQRVEQSEDRRPVRGRRSAVAPRGDDDRVTRLAAAAMRGDLVPDRDRPRRGVGRDERRGHRPAAHAGGARLQVGGSGERRQRAERGECRYRQPRTRRGYQRRPHPAQFGSQRCSSETCGAPSWSARRSARCLRTNENRNCCPAPPVNVALVPLSSTLSMRSSGSP